MAALVDEYPDRFPGFIGTAIMANPEKMVADARRNIEELGALGMQIFTNVQGKPLDLPEFEPFFCLYERGQQAGLDAPCARGEFSRLSDRE